MDLIPCHDHISLEFGLSLEQQLDRSDYGTEISLVHLVNIPKQYVFSWSQDLICS